MKPYACSIWDHCKKVFLSANNKHLQKLLYDILTVVRENYMIFERIAEAEKLKYIINMDINEYYIGKNGDNFELLLQEYVKLNNMSVKQMWEILSRLIWDLTIPVTNKVCPFCHCDHIAILMDLEKKHTYELCQTCLRISEDSIQVKHPVRLYPATKEVIDKKYILLSLPNEC